MLQTDKGANTGHGHVRPRPDGMRARCGGPRWCPECQSEQSALNQPPVLFIKALLPGVWKKPTPAQAKSGNYFKPRLQWYGLEIAIENPAGTVREGTDETGKAWRTVFKYAYGEFLGTRGMDGDPVDVFVGPKLDAPEVYVVRQMKRKRWDQIDEDKCMIGFPSMEAAKRAYLNHYDDPRFFGGIVAMSRSDFIKRVKLSNGKTLTSSR